MAARLLAAHAMHALGDKIASMIIAQSAGVPTIPWSGDHIRLPLLPDGRVQTDIPEQLYAEGEAAS